MNRKLLLIEDHPEMMALLSARLGELFDEVEVASDGESAMSMLAGSPYQFIMLDLMLPGVSGMEICRRVRARKNYIPIIMVTAKASTADRIAGLDAGADDYITKPFSMEELLSRVRARLRRLDEWSLHSKQSSTIRLGQLSIDVVSRKVEIGQTNIELTVKEFDLLHLLAMHPGRTYDRKELLSKVWGYSHDGYRHTVDTHVSRLRAKIEPDPQNPRVVETVWGIGYRLRTGEA